MPLLKLWGRALARMKILEEKKIVYSILGQSDFERAGAGQSELLPVLAEFMDNISGYNIIALLAESAQNSERLILAVHEQVPMQKLVEALGSGVQILNQTMGNYKIIEQNFENESLENLETRFLDTIKSV
jgi:hypothetical protein